MKIKTIILISALLGLGITGQQAYKHFIINGPQETQRQAVPTERMLSEFKKRYVDDPNSFYRACVGNGEYPMSNAIAMRCAEGLFSFVKGEVPSEVFYAPEGELEEMAKAGRQVMGQLEREIQL